MNAIPPWFPNPVDENAVLAGEDRAGLRWTALEEAGALVAALGGVEHGFDSGQTNEVARLIRHAEGWRRERAEHGVADLAAIMEPGIAALLSIKARGADPRPAAQALWREFAAARAAVLALLPAHA